MPLIAKERELAAVGISVATGCKPCTNYHLKAAREAGASEAEIKEAVNEAFAVRAAATAIMKRHALTRLGEEPDQSDSTNDTETNRIKELVCMGVAFGVNCVSSLRAHLKAADAIGISAEEIDEIMRLAAFIKDRAASHVERLAGIRDEEDAAKVAAQYKASFTG